MGRTPSLEEVIKSAIEYANSDLRVSLPARIKKYSADEQKADVEILLKRPILTPSGEEIIETFPILPDVPVVFPRAGDWFLSLPVSVGDLVLLIFQDFSIDDYLTNKAGVSEPSDFRSHDLSDAVALVGFYPYPDSFPMSANNLVLGKRDGAQIHIKNDEVNLYEENASDFVALAQKVLDELGSFKTDLDNLKTALSTHVHAGVTVGSGVTGTSPAFAPWVPHTPASVAAAKVKAT